MGHHDGIAYRILVIGASLTNGKNSAGSYSHGRIREKFGAGTGSQITLDFEFCLVGL